MKYSTKHHKYTPRTLEKHKCKKGRGIRTTTPLEKIQAPSFAPIIKNERGLVWEVDGGRGRVMRGYERLWEVVRGYEGLWSVMRGCERLWGVMMGYDRLGFSKIHEHIYSYLLLLLFRIKLLCCSFNFSSFEFKITVS